MELGLIAVLIDSKGDPERSCGRTQATEVREHVLLSLDNALQQTSPGELDREFGGNAVELTRQILYRRLNEQDVGRATFGGFAMDLFGYRLERASISIDSDTEFCRILTSGLIDKSAIAGTNVDEYAVPIFPYEFGELSLVELSVGAAAD